MLEGVKRTLLTIACVVAAFGSVAAQSGAGQAFGVIVYAEGYEFQLVREGRPRQYDVYDPDVLGLPLYDGDRIDTYEQTYLEIQLLPARSIVKIAENTSFEVEGVTEGGGGHFELAYGRVRARVERLVGTDPFEIRSGTAVAGVRGTDFGCDLVAESDAAVVSNVYCFEGTVEVTLREPEHTAEPAVEADEAAPVGDAADTPQRVEITANEMVSIVRPRSVAPPEDPGIAAADQDPQTEEVPPPVLAKQAVEPEIAAFWEERSFQETALEPVELAERFPSLEEAVSARFGSTPGFFTTPEIVEATPEPEPEVPVAVAVTQEPTDLPAAEEPVETREERRRRISDATRVVGWVLVGGGSVAELVGAGLWLYGDTLLPNAGNTDTLERTLMISGGVYLGGGLLSLLLSWLLTD